MDPVYLDFVAQERNEKDVRVKRGAKIEGGEMVFWCSQEQFQQDSRPLFYVGKDIHLPLKKYR